MRSWGLKDRERSGRRMGLGVVLLAVGTAACVRSQGPGTLAAAAVAGSGPQILVVSPEPATAQKKIGGQIVREICDPHTGKHWLLIRGNGHPGGPGTMELALNPRGTDSISGAGTSPGADFGLSALRPVIRAGDRLIVEEHTRLVEAYLEAVALGPATARSALNVRLKMGGKVVRAVAIGPGRAAYQAESGDRP